MKRFQIVLPLVACALLGAAGLTLAQDAPSGADDRGDRAYRQVVGRGVQFLIASQTDEGAWSPQAGPAITALATMALLRTGHAPEDPTVAKALQYLEQFVREDGGIYGPRSRIPNYETCVVMQCLAMANRDGRYEQSLAKAEQYVKGLQLDGDEGKTRADFDYGGAGYGKGGRPDLSNTAFLLDALQAAGSGPDDEAVQKALVFVSRCQNYESPHNTAPFAAKNPDGGFVYTVAADGDSPAGDTADGGLRSYGTMTYAGLKSMIFAGVGPDDERAKAAIGWLRKHYDVKEKPGMGSAGVYYYYHTFAKCLDAMKKDRFEDEQGVQHDWRRELIEELASRQAENGSWVNQNTRWLEGDPNLATAYALLSLSYCRPQP